MLKILIVTSGEILGGAERNYIRFYNLLKDQDWLKFSFILGNEYLYSEIKKEGIEAFMLNSLNLTSKFVSLNKYRSRLQEIRNLIDKIKPDFLISDIGVYIPQDLNVKRIIYIQDRNKFSFEYLSKIQDKFECAIVVSEPLYNYAKNYIDEKKLFLIPNWIEHMGQKPKAFDETNDFKVGWVSRLTMDKGWMDLVEAFKDSDIKIDFLGDGPDLQKAKEVEKQYTNLKFLGFLEKPWNYLRENTSVYVFSSKASYEGLPLSLLEAVSIGIPCIAYKTDITQYVLGENGLFYENIDELRGLVFRLKEDRDFYDEKARYSLERAKVFSKEQAKEKFISLLKRSEASI